MGHGRARPSLASHGHGQRTGGGAEALPSPQLMDARSVVDFWEQFASISMDNSAQSVVSKCNILRPDGTLIPCTVCYTLKRDIFDMPLCVVGSFLPIFSTTYRL